MRWRLLLRDPSIVAVLVAAVVTLGCSAAIPPGLCGGVVESHRVGPLVVYSLPGKSVTVDCSR